MKLTTVSLAALLAGGATAVAAPAAPPAPAPAPAAPAAAPAPAPAPAAAAPGGTNLTWWGHASWVLTTPGGATIVVDPWLENPTAPKTEKPKAADAILVTHGHFDHTADVASLAKATNAKVICSFELAPLLKLSADADGMEIGGTVTIKDATIHTVEALHASGFGSPKAAMQYGGAPMGFVVEVAKGPTIYFAGDTDAFAGMSLIAERYHPTVAVLPIGGYYTMDPTGAAFAAKMLKAKTVIPMHFGTFPALKGTPDELRAAMKKEHAAGKVVELKPGATQKL
jgi:L-ascorbate metabolism protein UlaG (beta-lactamase superfamily)